MTAGLLYKCRWRTNQWNYDNNSWDRGWDMLLFIGEEPIYRDDGAFLFYNYRFHDRIAWEVFTQGQYNKVNLINFRGLLGTGPRVKLTNSENYKFYLGTLAMFEYEEVDDGVTPLQRNLRGSSYLSFSLYPTERISMVSTTYYQPLFKQFSDYRISSESSLLVEMFTNFALKTTYRFIYDAVPAVGIPNSQYEFTTGITYSFD